MKPPRLVGILNVTPDSFSDGGKAENLAEAIAAIVSADVIDVGGESTRPGAAPVSAAEEWRRLEPVFDVLPQGIEISIDTRHAETARRALERGVHWINDVSGFRNDEMVAAVAQSRCGVVLMHSLGVPADPTQTLLENADPLAELLAFAQERIAALEAAGIARARIVFDPGIGFGKTASQSWQIIKRVHELHVLGVPLYLGHSRKSFLGTDLPPAMRDARTLEVSRALGEAGVQYLRVHDVKSHVQLFNTLRGYS